MTTYVNVNDGAGGQMKVEATRITGTPGTTTHKAEISTNANQQASILAKESYKAQIERIGAAAEAFNAFHKAYAVDFNLSEEELVSAGMLENLNCREFYPPNLGGKEGYDILSDRIYTWFEDNKNK